MIYSADIWKFPGKSAMRPWVLAARRIRRGALRLADLADGHASFSQFGEDRVIEQLFGDHAGPGFYVDVGAFHPYMASNTDLLYRHGWCGINIEPVATPVRGSPQTSAARPHIAARCRRYDG